MKDSKHNPPDVSPVEAHSLQVPDAKLLQSAFNTILDIICIFDPDDRLISCNRAGYEFFEVSPAEANGISRDTLFRGCKIESIASTHVNDDIQKTSGDILWFQKKSRYMRSTRTPVSSVGETDTMVVEQLTDVTEYVQILQSDEKQNLQYRQFVENMPFGLIVVQDGRIVLANNPLCSRYGVTRDALEGSPLSKFLTLIHTDDRNMLSHAMQVSDETCCISDKYEIRRISPPDDQGWCKVHTSRITYNGKPACQGIFHDISSTKLTTRALHETDLLLKAVFNCAKDPIFAKDRSLVFTHANPALEKLLQKSVNELIGNTDEYLFGKEVMDRLRKIDMTVLNGEIRTETESFTINGVEHTFQTTKVPIRDEEDEVIGLCAIARDITELQNTLTELEKSRRKYKRIFERFRDIYYETNLEGTILEVSPSVETFSKYKRDELIGQSAMNLYHDPGVRETLINTLKKYGRIDDFEISLHDADGVNVECSANIVLETDPENGETRIIGSLRNISGLKRVEKALNKSLREKEVLLREIHHRLKNNMQVISGLLTLQAQRTNDTTYQQLLSESISRVNSMSLIHESLYKSSSLSEIDMQQYFERLTRNLITLYRGDSGKVSVFIDTADISLSMDHAIPCGLIINELVSNALKHGFTDEAEGSILITMSRLSEQTIQLIISHTGSGFTNDVNWRDLPSLGLQLVVMLTEHQLDGTIELTTPERSEFSITFKRVQVSE